VRTEGAPGFKIRQCPSLLDGAMIGKGRMSLEISFVAITV